MTEALQVKARPVWRTVVGVGLIQAVAGFVVLVLGFLLQSNATLGFGLPVTIAGIVVAVVGLVLALFRRR